MAEGSRRNRLYGLSAGYLLIAVAVSILIAWVVGKWWYFFPVLAIAGGIYGIFLAVWMGNRTTTEGRSGFIYSLLWGGIFIIIGAELIVNDLYPGNAVLMIVVFILFLGIIALVAYALGRKK